MAGPFIYEFRFSMEFGSGEHALEVKDTLEDIFSQHGRSIELSVLCSVSEEDPHAGHTWK